MIIHGSVITISFLFTLCLKMKEDLGKSLFGTCSTFAISGLPLFGPAVIITYVVIQTVPIFYYKKRIPDISDGDRLKE